MSLKSVPIASLADVHSGGGAPQEQTAFSPNGLPFVRAGSLSKLLEGADEGSLERLAPEAARRHGLRLFPNGTILFAKSGMSATKGYIYSLKKSAYVVSHLAALVPHDPRDSGFLVRALQRFPPTTLIKDAAYPSIRLGDIERMTIAAPQSPAERQRIAAILDAADALRTKRRVTISKIHTLAQSLFFEMFGDPTTNPKGWPRKKCAELCDRITVGIVVRPASHYRDSGIPAIRGTNIKEDGIDLSDVVYFSQEDNESILAKTRVWDGDVVIVRSGRPGLAAVVPRDLNGANSIDVLIATPNRKRLRSKFLRDVINSPGGKRLVLSESRGQIQQHFNVRSLSEAELFEPPVKLQIEYERRVEGIEGQRKRMQHASKVVDDLFFSLQHRAFRGEL